MDARLNSPAAQPFKYPLQRDFVEPDWDRIPGFHGVSQADWESALWQRKHTLKNLKELKEVLGDRLPDSLATSIARDHEERATMSMLLPPQMLNTMNLENLWEDPVRRYMIPAIDDRRTDWANHPKASRDSLHEAEMWKVEGLTHRYPTKVLAELLSTCPQYCGHCTRMDLVGNDVPQVLKLKFNTPQKDRHQQILDYLRDTPSVRDVVVSGGDIANLPHQPARAVRQRAAGHRQHSRHPARLQGADGPAAALPAGQRARGPGAAGEEGLRARGGPGAAHPREPRPAGDAAGGQGSA